MQTSEEAAQPRDMLWDVDGLPLEPRPFPLSPAGVELDEELPTPILPDRSAVEYYSRTHNVWLPGTLRLAARPGTLLSEPAVTYHVDVSTRGSRLQRRENVAMDCLRAPLAEGESVEVFSATAKQWLPATVRGGAQGRNPTLNGYTLVLDASAGEGFAGRLLEGVPAVRVRRRFDEETLVSRYLGPVDGFELGSVSDGLGQGLTGATMSSMPGLRGPGFSAASEYSQEAFPAAPAKGNGTVEVWDAGLEGAEGQPDESEEGQISQWSWVQYEKDGGRTASVLVPSYVLSAAGDARTSVSAA